MTAANPEVLRKPLPPAPIRGPFRPTYEDGACDMRMLYLAEFTQVMQRL